MKRQISSSTKMQNRLFAVFIIMFQIGILFAYGYATKFKEQPTMNTSSYGLFDHSEKVLMYTFTALLAILGYGLMMSYTNYSSISGLATTIIVLSISVQGTPLLLRFWTSVFYGFGQEVFLSLETQRITMALCSSLLLSVSAFYGRLSNFQISLVTIFYNIGWTLSYIVTIYLQQKNGTVATSKIFDDYGTNYVYVFAGFFAFVFSTIANCKKGIVVTRGTRYSAGIAMIGTGFIFACFPFTGIFYPSTPTATSVNTTTQQILHMIIRNIKGPMNIYFSLTASVISTYIFSGIFGKPNMGVRQSIVGVISGGVTIAAVGGTINNIGGCIAIGVFSGLLSALYLNLLYRNIQFFQRIDHVGIIGPILFNSLIGALAVSPILYSVYDKHSIGGLKVSDKAVISYQFVNVGIACGTALTTAILAGIISLCVRGSHLHTDFHYSKTIGFDFGLYNAEQAYDNAIPVKQRKNQDDL